MPRKKQRTIRRRKRKAPCRRAQPSSTPAGTLTKAASLRSQGSDYGQRSPCAFSESSSTISSSDSEDESDGMKLGAHILEINCMEAALKAAVCCKGCGGQVTLKENLFMREGLCTHPYLSWETCESKTVNPFTKSSSRSLAVNRRAVATSEQVSCCSYLTFCALVGLPPIVSKHAYQQHRERWWLWWQLHGNIR